MRAIIYEHCLQIINGHAVELQDNCYVVHGANRAAGPLMAISRVVVATCPSYILCVNYQGRQLFESCAVRNIPRDSKEKYLTDIFNAAQRRVNVNMDTMAQNKKNYGK